MRSRPDHITMKRRRWLTSGARDLICGLVTQPKLLPQRTLRPDAVLVRSLPRRAQKSRCGHPAFHPPHPPSPADASPFAHGRHGLVRRRLGGWCGRLLRQPRAPRPGDDPGGADAPQRLARCAQVLCDIVAVALPMDGVSAATWDPHGRSGLTPLPCPAGRAPAAPA